MPRNIVTIFRFFILIAATMDHQNPQIHIKTSEQKSYPAQYSPSPLILAHRSSIQFGECICCLMAAEP